MIAGKAAFAAGAFVASLLGGVGLGDYTLGGFRAHQPVDIIAEMASDRHGEAFVPDPLPQVPIAHVCKGCDAKLYQDVGWDEAKQSYLADEGPASEDEGRWTVADDATAADEGAKTPDGSLAAYEAPVVIIAPDRPPG